MSYKRNLRNDSKSSDSKMGKAGDVLEHTPPARPLPAETENRGCLEHGRQAASVRSARVREASHLEFSDPYVAK